MNFPKSKTIYARNQKTQECTCVQIYHNTELVPCYAMVSKREYMPAAVSIKNQLTTLMMYNLRTNHTQVFNITAIAEMLRGSKNSVPRLHLYINS